MIGIRQKDDQESLAPRIAQDLHRMLDRHSPALLGQVRFDLGDVFEDELTR